MTEQDHQTREADMNTEQAGGCPVAHGRMSHPTEGSTNDRWWPESLNVKILRKHHPSADPMDDVPGSALGCAQLRQTQP